MHTRDKVILALDSLSRGDLIRLVSKVGSQVYALKIHDFYDLWGNQAIEDISGYGALSWVDAKLHDIPKTVELRAKALKKNGADIITVHASGGIEMMQAAMQSGAIIYAVTILTSQSEQEIHELYSSDSEHVVMQLALNAKAAGVHGIVCSPKEVASLRSVELLDGLELVTPGVRSLGVSNDDQKRVDTPANSLKAGASRLVIGRQLTAAADSIKALNALAEEISEIE